MLYMVAIGLAVVVTTMPAASQSDSAIYLERPPDVTIRRSQTAPLPIQIYRKGYTGPVEVIFTNFPNGVEVGELDRAIPGTFRRFTLRANRYAQIVVNQPVTVTVRATAPGQEHLIASATFLLTVQFFTDE